MKFSSALTLATLCTVLATETPREVNNNPMMAGIEGSITNSHQVMETLNRQLRSHDGHATADVISAFLTGADSQIDNAIATVSQALAPFTGGLSMAVGNFLLGPFVQSVTNGAEVMIANLIGRPFDAIDNAIIAQVQRYQKNLSRVSQAAVKSRVNTSQLNTAISRMNKFLAEHERHTSTHAKAHTGPREVNNNPMMAGIEGSINNSRQVMETLNRQLRSHDGHATADIIAAFITGADSQIDNAIATVSQALAPFTGGISMAIGNFLLGPVAQSVTNGAEVFLANIMGAPFDAMNNMMAAAIKSYQKNISRLATMASTHNVAYAARLNEVNTRLTNYINGGSSHKSSHH